VIRMDTDSIIRGGRNIQGRRMMNLGEGDSVVALATTNGKKTEEPDGDDQAEEALEPEEE
jgi:DNA gyrase subunit A